MFIPGTVAPAISAATGRPFELHTVTPFSGGDISQTYRLQGKDGSRYFIKLNAARHHAMFEAEAAGLAELAAAGALRVPRPVAQGCDGDQSFLVLEYLDLATHGDARRLGEALAAMHRHTAPRFGFSHDDFIGTTPQPNPWTGDWLTFWREQRLGFQLRLAQENGYGGELQAAGRALLADLPRFFDGYAPVPSLLHGDLWGGNYGYLADGAPVIFDPAVYYGDRECDVAMTELFGGFPPEFLAAYRAAWPLDAGYARRRDLYNLYHLLNHANLFGGRYIRQATQCCQLLAAA